jgi:hypothetical protein
MPSGWVVIREQHSDKLVSVPPALNVVQWQARDTAYQRWRIQQHADGTATLRSAANGLALECSAENKPGGEVFVTQPSGQPNQQWRLKDQSDGSVILLSSAHGMGLDIMEAAKEDGWIALMWKETGDANQCWFVEPAKDGEVRLRAKHSGLFLTVTPEQKSEGADVALWSDVSARWQQWRIEPVGDAFRIVNRLSSKVIQLSQERHTQKIDVEQGTYEGRPDQLWRIEPVREGWWRFLSVANGRSFDVMVRATADGTNLWSYDYNGGDNQLFRIEHVK